MNHPPRDPAAPTIKIHDKRRFNADGEPANAGQAPSTEVSDPSAAPHSADAELERLTAELDAARKRVDELARAYQAGERDREDFKQRMRREREQLIDVERGNVAAALLEAIDELDLCLSAAGESPLATGVRLIRDNLLKKAERTGITRVELLGTAYDPQLAEASDMELVASEADEGKVTSVLKACYQLNGRVVRPGRVRVAKYVKPAQA